MLCKVPNFLGKSTIEHKTNNFALVVKWQIGSANALPSHGPGNEETFRKWGNPQEARLEEVIGRKIGSPSRILGKPPFSSPEPLGLICNRPYHVTKKRRALGTRMGSPRIVVGAIFNANCKLQGSATVFLRKLNLRRRWTVCSLAWEAALKIHNHGKRVNCKISVAETL